MEYRTLGRTGVKVSALCLGCWVFGDRVSRDQARTIIAAALDAGINFLDTANMYGGAIGRSEEIVGEAVRDSGKRDRLIVATKVFFPVDHNDPNGRGISRRHVIAECENSLRRLQTDHIDLYYLHRLDPQVPIDETLRALDDLIRAGKIRYIGTSTAPAWSFVEALWVSKELGLNRFVAESPPYNLLDRRIERELIPMAQTFGAAVNPWTPLGAGLLTGIYRRGAPRPVGSRGVDPRHERIINQRLTDGVFDVVEALEPMAQEKHCSMAQLALAWVLRQPGVTSPVIGLEDVSELPQAIAALDLAFSAGDLERLDAAAPPGEGVSPFYVAEPSNFEAHPFRV